MINFKIIRKKWLNPTIRRSSVDLQDYQKHFQMAIINLEQNLIEERMPELKKSA
jgi:hypothetical protein